QPWPALLRAQRTERAVPAGPHPHLCEQALMARWRHRGAARRAQVHRLCDPADAIVRHAEPQPSAGAPATQSAFRSRRRADAFPAVLIETSLMLRWPGLPGHLLLR